MSRIHDFTKTIYYIIIVFLFTLLCWRNSATTIGISILSLFASFLLFTKGPVEGLIPLMYGAMFVSRDYLSLLSFPWIFFISAILVIAGVIYYIARKMKEATRPKMLIGFILFAICCIISLINLNPNGQNVRYLYSLAPLLYLGIYVFFACFVKEGNERYLCYCLLLLGITLSCELLIEGLDLGTFKEKIITLGWGGANTVSIFINIAIVAASYLLSKAKKTPETIFLVSSIIWLMILQCLTLCRTGFLALAIMGIPIAIITIIFSKRKKELIVLGLSTFIIIVAIVFINNFDDKIINIVFKKGLDDTFRFKIWNEAFEGIKQHPIIGNGLFSYGITFKYNDWYRMMVCHNTFIQCIYSFGIIGAISLLIHYFEKYKTLYKNMTQFKYFFVLICVITFIHGMLDNTYFMIYYMLVIIPLFAIEEKSNNEEKANNKDVYIEL